MNDENERIDIIDSIAIIRQTIEKTRFDFCRLSLLFLLFGIFYIAALLMKILLSYYFSSKDMLELFALINYVISFAVILFLFIWFLKLRDEVKNNEYTLKLFELWGVIFFLIPVICFIISFIGLWANNMALLSFIRSSVKHISFFTALLFTGIMIDRRLLKYLGIVLIIAYPFCFIMKGNFSNNSVDFFGDILFRLNMVEALKAIIYVFIGLYFKLSFGGDLSGDK